MKPIRNAWRFYRRHTAGISWASFVAIVLVLTFVFPTQSATFLWVELAVAMAFWSAYFTLDAQRGWREATRLRIERDREREATSELRELIHQHLLTVLKDDNAGPDAVARARELAATSRELLYASLAWRPDDVMPERTP